MTKSELIKKTAEVTGKTIVETTEVIDTFFNLIDDALVKGEQVQFVGWGSFDVKTSAARTGRNPKTGEVIQIDAKKSVKFKAGKKLNEKVNA